MILHSWYEKFTDCSKIAGIYERNLQDYPQAIKILQMRADLIQEDETIGKWSKNAQNEKIEREIKRIQRKIINAKPSVTTK